MKIANVTIAIIFTFCSADILEPLENDDFITAEQKKGESQGKMSR
jgi:hypothetical protein